MRQKRFLAALFLAAAVGSGLIACGNHKEAAGTEPAAQTEETQTEAKTETEAEQGSDGETAAEEPALRIGALKGPTAMGLVNLMKEAEEGTSRGRYRFTIDAQPDALAAKLAAGDVDIALLPANLAGVLYHKTGKEISVIDINTLGVLYCVTGDDSVRSIKDLSGKTVLTTGQGATPEYVLSYLLKQNAVADCQVEFKSEATEVAAALKADPSKVAVLPQPFATAALMQNDALKTAFSLTDAWDALDNGSRLITGVTVVRNQVLTNQKAAVDLFMEEQKESVDTANASPSETAERIAAYGILDKIPVVEKALPLCNLVCISGEEMKGALSGYLETLCAENPKSVGGAMPGDDFYYIR